MNAIVPDHPGAVEQALVDLGLVVLGLAPVHVPDLDAARHEGDVSTLDLGHVRLNRDNMANDGFHPGTPVYRAVADALTQHVAQHVMPRLHIAAA